MSEMITVKRHTLLYRFLHWFIALQVLILVVTGLGVSEYIPLTVLGRDIARNIHIIVALLWTGTITFFVYYFVMSGEYKWFGLSKVGQAVDFFVHELECFIKGKRVKSPINYDSSRRKYDEKVIPTEVLTWWGWFVLWVVMVLTGLALLFPDGFGFVNRLSSGILPAFATAAMATRFIHLVLAVGMVVFALIHAYASWTFGMVGSMISGMNKEPVSSSKS